MTAGYCSVCERHMPIGAVSAGVCIGCRSSDDRAATDGGAVTEEPRDADEPFEHGGETSHSKAFAVIAFRDVDGVWTLQVSAALDGDLARAARNELEAMQTEIDEAALRAGRIGTMHVDSVHEQIPGWTVDAAFVRGDA